MGMVLGLMYFSPLLQIPVPLSNMYPKAMFPPARFHNYRVRDWIIDFLRDRKSGLA